MDVIQVTADGDTTTEAGAATLPTATAYTPGTFTCNAYLVRGERTTLIDAGQVAGVVDAIDTHVDTVDAVVLTHQHGDHVGQLDAVYEAFAPERCYAHAEHPRRTDAIADGDRLQVGDATVDVLYTPGHAPDHVALVGETTVFTGDLVVPNDEAFEYGSFGSTGGPGPGREQLIESIEALSVALSGSVEHLYAGHGDAFHGDVRDLVETALERARERAPKYA